MVISFFGIRNYFDFAILVTTCSELKMFDLIISPGLFVLAYSLAK